MQRNSNESMRAAAGAWRLHKYALKWRINGVFDCSGPGLNRTRLHVVIFIFACEQEEQQRVGREREARGSMPKAESTMRGSGMN